MDEDKTMSLSEGLIRIRKFSEDFYKDYPKTPENRLALSKTLLVEAAVAFLSDVSSPFPTEEDAKFALDAAYRAGMLLNDIKEEIMKRKRTTTNWSN